jgi:hypothetical protein
MIADTSFLVDDRDATVAIPCALTVAVDPSQFFGIRR